MFWRQESRKFLRINNVFTSIIPNKFRSQKRYIDAGAMNFCMKRICDSSHIQFVNLRPSLFWGKDQLFDENQLRLNHFGAAGLALHWQNLLFTSPFINNSNKFFTLNVLGVLVFSSGQQNSNVARSAHHVLSTSSSSSTHTTDSSQENSPLGQ